MVPLLEATMDKKIENEMTQYFGFVPDFYKTVPEAAQHHAWGMQRDLELAQTALDPRTKELIGLAVAAQIKCQYCTYFHMAAARAHGVSDEEMREAVLMGGFTDMMSNALNGASYDLAKFKKEVDKAMQHMQNAPQPTASH
jgi:AhpD family alkylhydroperoxidase